MRLEQHFVGKLLQQFAGLYGVKVEGGQVRGPNGYVLEQVKDGVPLLAYGLNVGPALMFVHSSPEQCKMVLKAIGLWTVVVNSGNYSAYSAQDGKVSVRQRKLDSSRHGKQEIAYEVLHWQDGLSEVAYESRSKKAAYAQAKFIRKQFRELDKAVSA